MHEVGFTTTFTAEHPRDDDGQWPCTTDIDLTSMRDGESTTLPTYAAVTARSFHPGGVSPMLLDGSVRFVKNTVDQRSGAASARGPAARSSARMPTDGAMSDAGETMP